MGRIATLKPRLGTLDQRRVRPPAKQVDSYYRTPEHSSWRAEVIAAAGGRCEHVENGRRCERAAPQHRMFADHVHEIKDGGDRQGVGRCLCSQHHSLKTIHERSKRMSQRIQGEDEEGEIG